MHVPYVALDAFLHGQNGFGALHVGVLLFACIVLTVLAFRMMVVTSERLSFVEAD
jgi:hypothetical protein